MSIESVYRFDNIQELNLPEDIIFDGNCLKLKFEDGYYSSSNPSFIVPVIFRFSKLYNLTINTNNQGEIRVIVNLNQQDYFFNKTEWQKSDGTFSQSTLLQNFENNITSLITKECNFTLKIFIHSDGLQNPEIYSIRILGEKVNQEIPLKTKVYGKVEGFDPACENFVVLNRDRVAFSNLVYLAEKIPIQIQEDGTFEIYLYNTDIMSPLTCYKFSFNDCCYYKRIPNVSEIDFNSLPEKY